MSLQHRDKKAARGKSQAIQAKADRRPQAPVPLAASGYALQRKQVSPGGSDALDLAGGGVEGSGSALPHLATIQQAFGHHDVSGVQAHGGAAAQEANEALGASAYASGEDIAFKEAPDLHTAAHEAAHVVQQRSGVDLPGGIGQQGDRYEQQADAVADKVVSGQDASAMLDGGNAGHDSGAAAPGGAVQLDPDDEVGDKDKVLEPEQAQRALRFCTGRGYDAKVWQQVGEVLEVAGTLGEPLVQAIAAFQKERGLDTDGKPGDMTMQWLALHPNGKGKGLEVFVKSEHTVFVGIRKASRGAESAALESAAGRNNVTKVMGTKKEDHIKVGTKWVDIKDKEGIATFVGALPGLADDKKAKLTEYLEGRFGQESGDEIGQLIQTLHRVESGQMLMKRMVLSGHSGGTAIAGDGSAQINFNRDLGTLAKIFPNAFAQVEDVMVSGCNTGQYRKLDQHWDLFPNLKTIWAYAGWSPSPGTGSTRHIKKWEAGSKGRGDANVEEARKDVGDDGGKRDMNPAVWTEGGGYNTDNPDAKKTLYQLEYSLQVRRPSYEKAYNKGEIDIADLRELQIVLQSMIGHEDRAQLSNLSELEAMNHHVLCLRHWKEVSESFVNNKGTEVAAGYKEIGTTMPEFGHLSRTEALAAIANFKATGSASQTAYKLLTEVLKELRPEHIPLNWVT